MVDFVPFPGMASTDNNIQYPANEIMITGNSGTVTASGSMVIVPATGNVGINTTNPQFGFDVNVSANFRQTVTAAGNVGIGTTSSVGISNVLSVYGTAQLHGNLVIGNIAAGGAGIYFADGTFQNTAGGGGGYSNLNTASYLSGPVLIGNLYIGNNTISTSTSTGALIMNGGAGIGGNIYAGGNVVAASLQPTSASVPPVGVYLPSGNTLGFTTAAAERARFSSQGNLLIGSNVAPSGSNATVVVQGLGSNGGGIEISGGTAGGGNIYGINGGGLVFGTYIGPVGTEIYSERARIDANGNVIIRGSVGIGTSTAAGITTPTAGSNLYVWGNIIIANTATTSSALIFPNNTSLSGGVFGPSGTIQVAGVGNSFTGDSSNFFWDNNNKRLGIGTGTPSYQFSLYGTDYVLFNSRPGNSARQEITVGNVVSYGAVLGYDPTIPQSIGYLRRGDSAATSPAIAWSYVSSNYRVGINAVTQPQNAMEVNGGLVIGNNYVGFAAQTNANGASIQGAVGIGTFTPSANINNPLTVFAATGGGIELVSGGAAGGGNIVALTSGGLKFSNFTGAIGSESYTETMRINSSGYVGVNTASPAVRFTIGNNASGANEWAWFNTNSGGATPNASMTTGLAIGGNYSAGGSEANLVYGTYLTFAKWNGTTYSESMRITNAGNINMGTTTSGGFLTLQRGGSASTAPDIATGDGTQSTYINSNWASGSYNPYVQAGDHGIIFHNGSTETGQFVISQWSSIAKGLRINTSGNVAMANNLPVTGEVYAYYSDSRLKDNIEPISNAINIINSISGVYYNANDLAVELLREDKTARKVGVLAQEIQAVMPEVVRQAPFDIAADGSSISGENYQTVQYDKLVPLLIQAVKEQTTKIAELEARITLLELDP